MEVLREQVRIVTQKYKEEQKENRRLRSENEKIAKQSRQRTITNVRSTLQTVFTEGQINLLLSPNKKWTHWTDDDIASAISLRCVSPKCYRFLRSTMKLPLPGFSTLNRWVRNIDLSPGRLRTDNYEVQGREYARNGQIDHDTL